jgi:hypothetical protein
MKTKPLFTSSAVLVTLLVLTAGTAHAGLIFEVTLNTTPLTTASAAAPFSLAFQLVQGSQPNNNTATISDFLYGVGGSAGSGCPAVLSPCIFGGASGDISSSVTLNTSSAFNALVETFTPGSSLSFLVDLTTNVDAGGTPDAFAFSILDSGGGSIPTLDPSGADTLLTINIDSASPAILTYATDPIRNTLGGTGPSITMDAPTVNSVPEPGTLVLLATGIFWGGVLQILAGRLRR